MFAPDNSFYPVLVSLITILVGSSCHRASVVAIAQLVWALLFSQSLHVSDLGRALPDSSSKKARQRMRRVRRVLGRDSLSSEYLTPILIRVVLSLVKDQVVVIALDSTRCRRWEIFTIGVVFHGRTLPIAWAAIAYPWQKKTYTPTVISLIQRTFLDGHWPANRELHFAADRGFPSLDLFRLFGMLRQDLRLGYTIRLRAGDWVSLSDGSRVKLADLMGSAKRDQWTCVSASYQRRYRNSAPANLVIGKSTPIPPVHQRGPSDQKRREARAARRIAHVASKRQPNARQTDDVWALLSTAATPEEARAFYEHRFRIEGTYRDLKTWHLEEVIARETDRKHVEGYTGLAVLAYLVQSILGAMAGCADSALAQASRLVWCTTDRLSIFWVGRQVLHESADTWRTWLKNTSDGLCRQLEGAAEPAHSRPRRRPTKSPNRSPLPTSHKRRRPNDLTIPAHS